MPNTREKPIEQKLKNGSDSICDKCFHRKVCRAIDNQPCIECNQFTDAHGVTVQEWISVKDRLPMMAEVGEFVLVYTNENRHLIVTCWAVHKHKDQIIAWMPLPQPPKGE
jgi:hypothetical protein